MDSSTFCFVFVCIICPCKCSSCDQIYLFIIQNKTPPFLWIFFCTRLCPPSRTCTRPHPSTMTWRRNKKEQLRTSRKLNKLVSILDTVTLALACLLTPHDQLWDRDRGSGGGPSTLTRPCLATLSYTGLGKASKLHDFNEAWKLYMAANKVLYWRPHHLVQFQQFFPPQKWSDIDKYIYITPSHASRLWNIRL